MKSFFSILTIFICQISFAQKLEKGFNCLKEYDYFQAKKIFYNNLKKAPAPSAFGLANIFIRRDNPFHNYDSAYKYCMISLFAIRSSDEKTKVKISSLGVDEKQIYAICDTVFEYSYSFYLNKANRKTDEKENLLNHYSKFYFFSKLHEDAINERDKFILERAKQIHTSDNYKLLLKNYPQFTYSDEVNYLIDKSIYEENTAINSISAYKNFISNFPENRFVLTAQNEIYKITKKNQDKNGLIKFIRDYPKNENCNEAWKLFFTLSVKIYNSENLADFVLEYPDFPFKKTIIQEIELLNKPLYKIKSNELFGYIDSLGNEIIPPNFEDLGNFSEGLCLASEKDKYGFIDKNGSWVIKPSFDEVESFIDGVCIVKNNNKSFLINRTADKISEEYDEMNTFSEGLAVARLNQNYGAINRTNNIIIPFKYDKLGDFINGHAWFQLDGKYGMIDAQNFVTIKNEFDWLDNYSNLIRAKKNNGYGLIDNNGNKIIPFEYERIEIHSSGLFMLIKNGKYSFADRNGCLYSKFENDFDNKLSPDDLIKIPDTNKQNIYFKIIREEEQALMNQNGKLLCNLDDFEEIYLPSCGLIRIFNNDKYSFLDLKMKPAFNTKFDEAEDYYNCMSIVKKKSKWQIIDKSGNVAFEADCESIERPEKLPYKNNYFMVKNKQGIGILMSDLKWLLEPEYESIEFTEDNFIELIKDNKKCLFNIEKNKIIWKEK